LPSGWDAKAKEVAAKDLNVSTRRLTGFCFMVSRKAFEQIGVFDEQFFPGWYEDTDFELRLIKAGHAPMQVSNVLIHHYKNKTLDTIPGFRENMISINRDKFNKKHGLA
jgi:GT2 family glycosyltransferase